MLPPTGASREEAGVSWYRFFWQAHKWVGLTVAAFLLLIAVTGFLLLLKKEFTWIQPPTQEGAPAPGGSALAFVPLFDAWTRVRAVDHPDFQHADDIDRIDVRPGKRVYKFRSKHNHTEIQVDAVSGRVLGVDTRTSDWLETLHDGSWIGKPVHDYWMPLVAIGVAFLSLSGVWLWIRPFLRRRARRRKQAALGHRAG